MTHTKPSLRDEIEKARNDIFAAERTRNGLLYMDAKIRLEELLECQQEQPPC